MYQRQNKIKILFACLLTAILLNFQLKAENTITISQLEDKMRGMCLGQIIGNMAGRPTEGVYKTNPNPDPCVPWVIRHPNSTDPNEPNYWDADDDTDIEYIAMHILETDGFDCNSQQIAEQWLRHSTAWGIYIANLQAWYLMGDGLLPPQTGSRTYNEHWYAIDSQITTETLGAVSPGLPQQAADMAGKFARITNEGFPVHSAQLYAVMYANAFFEPNVVKLVTNGLEAIPQTSRTHQVAGDVLNWYLDDVNDGEPNWRDTRKKLCDKYYGANSFGRYYLWVESTVNTGATILAILYGDGDFKDTVQTGVLSGWDNDCNPATAGGLIGIIEGFSGLPADLVDPNICTDIYQNKYRPYLPDPNLYRPQYETITSIAERLRNLAVQNILENDGWADACDANIYHIPLPAVVIPESEKPDPNGPAGLVADAIDAAITVTTSAAVEYHDPNYDRDNLDAIINGITDNSYNGHKAYWSRYSVQPLQQDWYQLNFSQPVKFGGLTFYEGDIVWKGINTYYKNDDANGGFFEDLTVEILRDGQFIEPANLQTSESLDRYKMYQAIEFTFADTVGDAIRITGTPGGRDKFTTIMELQAEGSADPGLFVASVKIADGLPQRSSIKKIQFQFNRDAKVTKDDLDIAGVTYGTIVDMNNVSLDYNTASYQTSLTFSQSLPDDTYALNLRCATIIDDGGSPLLDDDVNPADGFYTINFHRLFGDADGSADIDLHDFSVMGSCWQQGPVDSGLDINGNSLVDVYDLTGLCENWLFSF